LPVRRTSAVGDKKALFQTQVSATNSKQESSGVAKEGEEEG